MDWIALLIGVVLGGVIGFLWAKSTLKNNVASLPSDDEKLQTIQEEANTLRMENSRLQERVTHAQKQFESIDQELTALEKQYKISEKEKIQLFEERKHLNEKLAQQKQDLKEMQETFKLHFENIATKIFDENSKKFTNQNEKRLGEILSPFKDRLDEFKKKIEENHKEEQSSYVELKTNIKHLTELNQKMTEEAKNLTDALKGDNKTQGNWGELILERVLETSGLRKDEEYKLEASGVNVHGTRIRPDAVIFLPDDKHIIIDSKVSLKAYEQYVNADDEGQKKIFLKKHIDSLKAHIKSLSEKDYTHKEDIKAPDFTLLFIPIEPSFALAMQGDYDLFNFAWDKKIVIVTPTTLLATLRTIASVWKQERQNRNAQEIARRAGLLYDKFVNFIDDMQDIQTHIERTQKSYNQAYNKLSSGTGNLIRQTEMLRELGANSSKKLDDKLIDESSPDA